MSSRKNLVALAFLLCLTTLLGAVSAGPNSILPATTFVNSHVTSTGGAAPSGAQLLATISPLTGGLASTSTVQLDANSACSATTGVCTKNTITATLATSATFRAGVVITGAANPSLNQALLPNANFKFCVFVGSPQACSSSTVWVAGAVVIVDTNGNNVYDTGEQVVAGSAPTVGTTGFKADPKIKFIDSNANNVYDFGETVVYDNGNTGLWSSVANDPYIGPAVFGFQFGMTYDPTFLIPQMDPCLAASALGCPAASTSPDGAGSTVLLGGTSTNCPIYQRLSGASGGCNFAASVAANTGSLAISATAGKMLIGFTYLAPRNGTFINAATLLGNIAFEILKSGSTTISLSATDLKFVDINANVIPFYALGVQVTDTITIGNNPPVASFTFTHLAAGDTSCAAITGSNCGTLAFRFDGSASVASGTATIANPTGYFWDFGDNTQDSSSAAANLCAEPTAFTYLTCNQGPTAIHDYNATVGGGGPGTWDATLRIVDSNAATGSARDNTGTVILNVQPSHIDHMVIAQPPANPTTTVVSCNPSTVAFGASTTCTATVTDTSATPTTPTGTVTFTSSGTGTFTGSPCTLSGTGASATCSASYSPTGTGTRTDTITGSYNGDTGHSTSSGTFSLSVGAVTHPTTTTVACTPSTVAINQATSCTATVTDTSTTGATTPTGTVTFTPGGTCTLAGTGASATCSVSITPTAAGSLTVSASYAGDSTHGTSSGSTTVTVNLRTTTTTVACTPSSVIVGQATSCTATVTDTAAGTASTPTGTVTFTPGGTCTLAGTGASATCSVSVAPTASGTLTVSASYGGDATHATSTGSASVTVKARPTTTTVACTPSNA